MPVTPSSVPDLRPLMRDERGQLIDLLAQLSRAEWDQPTECPAWSVRGIALHLVGDDLSLLSRQRDAEPSGLIDVAARNPGRSFLELLDLFNQGFVGGASFISPNLILDLLGLTGEWTANYYANCDLEERGEPVFWVGPDPAPYRFIVAREYGERWIHHLQIARATSRSGPVEPRFVLPAAEMSLRVIARFIGSALAGRRALIGIEVADLDASWMIGPDTDGIWQLADTMAAVDVGCTIASSDLPACFSFGLAPAEVRGVWTITGDPYLVSTVETALADSLTRR